MGNIRWRTSAVKKGAVVREPAASTAIWSMIPSGTGISNQPQFGIASIAWKQVACASALPQLRRDQSMRENGLVSRSTRVRGVKMWPLASSILMNSPAADHRVRAVVEVAGIGVDLDDHGDVLAFEAFEGVEPVARER